MPNEYIIEPPAQTVIAGQYDVVVVGGGIAGIAAAVAAGRNGAKTLLIEKQFALGGLSTLGIVVFYLPLCDGNGRQVTFGLAEELMLLTTMDNSATLPDAWTTNASQAEKAKSRYELKLNPASAILAFEKFILDNDVSLLYDTRFCSLIKSEDTIRAVIVENKTGRFAIQCRCVIDATGDADVCNAAGEETVTLTTNTASGWYYNRSDAGNELFQLYKPYDSTGKSIPAGSGKGFDGTDGDSVTEMMVASRNLIREHIRYLRKENDTNMIWPFLIPTVPGFRMTRRLKGRFDFPAEDRKIYDDSIGLISNWYKSGPIYSIPFRSLSATRTTNLLAAGRCISAVGNGWNQSRAIPGCAVTGQAAGTAAAIEPDISKIKIKELQKTLEAQKCQLSMICNS